jgi:pyruvate dehydrogenase E2 component (dihydrolipoamide acetyltransferase)
VSTPFKLPELGENVSSAEVLRVLVKAGETVEREQPVLELETDKATVEVPSSVEGTVTEVLVKAGDRLEVGQVVFVVGEDAPEAVVGSKATAPSRSDEGEPAAAPDEREGQAEDASAPPVDRVEEPATAPSRDGATTDEPAAVEFVLPELGEGVASADVLRVLVKPGDRIRREQPVLELETDKATVEVPSSVEGTVTDVRVEAGGRIAVGDVVLVVEGRASGAPTKGRADATRAERPDRTGSRDAGTASVEPEAARRPTRPAPPDKPGMLADMLEEEAAARQPAGGTEKAGPTEPTPAPRAPAAASPTVRRAARELGVDIHDVAGTGSGGRISVDDVKAHVKRIMLAGGPAARRGAAPGRAPSPLPDFAKWGPVERRPMRGIRRKTAEHLSDAWWQIPHVTQCDLADITELEQLRSRFGKRAEAAGGKLTVTAVALKVVASALRVFPQFNTSVDMAKSEIVQKQYVHIGVAVDTDRGLLVPVIRDVDRKNIVELSRELAEAAERARTRKITIEEMEGGSFTITNLGGIGGTSFTPIVNHPEVAILGLSRARTEPVWRDGTFVPRLMLPLSLSYDHRVIDGADAIRFLRWVVEALEQPFLLSLQG